MTRIIDHSYGSDITGAKPMKEQQELREPLHDAHVSDWRIWKLLCSIGMNCFSVINWDYIRGGGA